MTTANRNNSEMSPAMQHLLANDLAELVHIFKEDVVVRHSPTPAGEKLSPKYASQTGSLLLEEGDEGHEQLTV